MEALEKRVAALESQLLTIAIMTRKDHEALKEIIPILNRLLESEIQRQSAQVQKADSQSA